MSFTGLFYYNFPLSFTYIFCYSSHALDSYCGFLTLPSTWVQHMSHVFLSISYLETSTVLLSLWGTLGGWVLCSFDSFFVLF